MYNKNHLITEFSKEKFSDYEPAPHNTIQPDISTYTLSVRSVYGTERQPVNYDALTIMAPDATMKG